MPVHLSDQFHRRGDGGRKVAVLSGPSTQPDAGVAGPYRLLAFETLASTNDEAMARLRAGDPGGLWISATSQSGGRGRQGRAWISPPGNLYASLALSLAIEPAIAPQLGFVAGVALASVLRQRLGNDPKLRIKWPNDMIFDGAKLAGLLLESAPLRDGQIGCVIGFGVNCRSHPDRLAYPATDLTSAGDPHSDPQEILSALAEAMALQLAIWDKGSCFHEIRTAWLALAIEPGTRLVVALAERRLPGIFQGLDPTGRLQLGTEDGCITIDAGDVFLPSPSVTSV